MKLQILICTLGSEGLRRVASMNPPHINGVGYVVSCQDPDREIHDPFSILPRREDMEVFLHPDRGLGLNRRHAMEHATADFILLADDDLEYYPEKLKQAVGIMESRPDLDIFAFRFDGSDGKIYPSSEHDLAAPCKGYFVSSVELAFRLASVREAGIRFSHLTGVGAPYLKSGEESIFTERSLQAGLKGRFFPVTILHHPGPTTGTRQAADPGQIRSTAAYIRIKYGIAEGLLRCMLLAKRAPLPYFKALRYALQGFRYSIRHDNEL